MENIFKNFIQSIVVWIHVDLNGDTSPRIISNIVLKGEKPASLICYEIAPQIKSVLLRIWAHPLYNSHIQKK